MTKYLVFFVPEKYDAIFNRIRCLISVKSSTSYVVTCNYGKTKIYPNDDFSLEKTLTFHDAVILIKSLFNKSQNQYYCHVFLEKFMYQLENDYFWIV